MSRRISGAFPVVVGCGSLLLAANALALQWAGNASNNADHGVIASSQPLVISVESYPAQSALGARVLFSINGGVDWDSVGMAYAGPSQGGANDRWKADLGTFAQGTTIRYAIEVTGPDQILWDSQNGQDYFVTVSNEAAAIRWMGNLYTYPEYGSLDPGADLWINVRMWPPGVGQSAFVGYSIDDGQSWTSVGMSKDAPVDGNDAWHVNVGGFPAGTSVRYYVSAANGKGDVFWDSNQGADYRMRVNSLIRDVYTDKGRHNPGETGTILVDLYNTQSEVTGVVSVKVMWLTREVASFEQAVTLPQWSGQQLSFPWVTPGDDYRGYGIEVDLIVDGEVRDTRSSAMDVSSDWIRFPRYGFFCDYYPGDDAEGKARTLAKYHINALQFYDWKWTHDRLVPYAGAEVADLYTQPDGRVQSFNTVKAKVAAAHSRNMAALSYALMYGDSGNDTAPEQVTWAAFTQPNSTDLADIRTHKVGYTIWVMDVSHPGWKSHIIGQFHDAMDKAGFDGIHLDNLGGSWSYPYNSAAGIDESVAFPAFIREARDSLRSVYPQARVAHNDVAGGYQAAIAGSDTDVYYTEVWTRDTYQDIRENILSAKADAGDKAVVLAAYINRQSWETMSEPTAPPLPTYINDASAKLMAACVFANGGFRVELGEDGEMLVNEYFPLRSPRMHDGLKRSMRDYYDFAVRYENFLFFNTLGNVVDGTDAMRLTSATHALTKEATSDAIWAITKEWRDEYLALNLINLNGVDTQWRNPSPNPVPQKAIALMCHTRKKVQRILLASPDDGLGRATEIPFSEGLDADGYYVTLTVPDLRFWDLLLLDQTTKIKVDGWPGEWSGVHTGALHSVAVDAKEWIYRGEVGDRRTFAGSAADADITEVRVTSDDTYVYFLIRFAEVNDASLPGVGIAWNNYLRDASGRFPWIGDASTPDGSIGLEHPSQYASRQMQFYWAGGAPAIRLYNGEGWYVPNQRDSAIAVSEEFDALEARIHRADLDAFEPQWVTFSLVSFRNSGNEPGTDATLDSPDDNNDALDVMGGVPGVSENAWARDLSDNRVGLSYDLILTADGVEAPSQALVVAPAPLTSCDETVTLRYNARGRTLHGAEQVYLHLGHNGWQDILATSPAMTPAGPDQWVHTYTLPLGTEQLDLVFYDGSGRWDNRGGEDWHLPVLRCVPDASDAVFELSMRQPSEWNVAFPRTLEGYRYELFYRTNLVSGAWTPLGLNLPGSGDALFLVITNQAPTLYLRSGVQPVDGSTGTP